MGHTSANLYRRKFAKKFSIRKNSKKFRKFVRNFSEKIFFEIIRKIFRNIAKIFSKFFEKIFFRNYSQNFSKYCEKKNSTDLRIKVQNRRSVQTFIIVYQFSQTFEKFCIFYFSYTVYCTIIFFYS